MLGYLQNKLRIKRITFQLAFAISANELSFRYEQNFMNLQPERTVRLWIKRALNIVNHPFNFEHIPTSMNIHIKAFERVREAA